MFKIGYRTLKTAIGTTLAILLAQFLQLENFASAGILTILCIQVTKRRSIKASIVRVIACFLALLFSVVIFEVLAYHPIMIGVLLLLFIPTTVVLKVQQGIVTSSVIILQVFTEKEVTWNFIQNQSLLIFIGIGMALLLNLYMPSLDRNMKQIQQRLDTYFSSILKEMSNYLKTNEETWQGEEMTGAAECIKNGKMLAYRDFENHLLQDENIYFLYFKMREKQFEIIERLLPLLKSFQFNSSQSLRVADFIEQVSENVHPGNTASHYLYLLYKMKIDFDQIELPQTKQEFEERSALFYFIREMEQYLQIKSHFKGIQP